MIVMSKSRRPTAQAELFDKVYGQIPAFADLFDEETFYVFAALFVACTCLVAFVLSRFVVLKPVE